jgi:hypothetical protein
MGSIDSIWAASAQQRCAEPIGTRASADALTRLDRLVD